MAKNFTKQDLIDQIAFSTDIVGGTKAGASRVLDLIIGTINSELAQGNSVDVSGLCKFTVATQAAKHGTVPGSNPPRLYSSPAKRVVKIKPSKALRDRVL